MANLVKLILKKAKTINKNMLDDTAEVYVKYAIKKDLIHKSSSLMPEINGVLPVLLTNYVKCCEYLLYDFGVICMKIEGKDTALIDEVGLPKKVKKYIGKYDAPIIRRLDKININKRIKKWQLTSLLLRCYPDVLEKLLEVAHGDKYKDIIISQELELIDNNKHLIEDFSKFQNG